MKELLQELQNKRSDLLRMIQQSSTDSQNIQAMRHWFEKRGREVEQFVEFLKQ